MTSPLSENNGILIPDELVMNQIYQIRGQKVMFDGALAKLYGVETKVLNQAVRQNSARFPDDFMLELNTQEFDSLRSQIVTLKNRGSHTKYLPTYKSPTLSKLILNKTTIHRHNISTLTKEAPETILSFIKNKSYGII